MDMSKRYYWLKLENDFFSSTSDIRIKKLRSLAGGDTFTIIYLKMMLSTLTTDGVITFEGIEENIAQEIALRIDENPDNVQVTINYLINTKLLVEIDENTYSLPYVAKHTGSEGASAERMRSLRQRHKASLCDRNVHKPLQVGDVESESESEKESESEIESESVNDDDRPTDRLTQIRQICEKYNLSINPEVINAKISGMKISNLERYLIKCDQEAKTSQKSDSTKFNSNFHQREYDFENLESQLLKAERKEET
jgi:predicted phage replisome organizer